MGRVENQKGVPLLTITQFTNYKSQALAFLSKTEGYKAKFSHSSKKFNNWANSLGIATIVLGALTGANGLTSAATNLAWLTPVLGILTAITAGVKPLFNWEKKAQSLYNACSNFDNICSEVENHIWKLSHGGVNPDETFFTRMTEKFNGTISELPNSIDLSDIDHSDVSRLSIYNIEFAPDEGSSAHIGDDAGQLEQIDDQIRMLRRPVNA